MCLKLETMTWAEFSPARARGEADGYFKRHLRSCLAYRLRSFLMRSSLVSAVATYVLLLAAVQAGLVKSLNLNPEHAKP